jgi:hypothetical protein
MYHISTKSSGVAVRGQAIRAGAINEGALCGASLVPGEFVGRNAGDAAILQSEQFPLHLKHLLDNYCPRCVAGCRRLMK